LDRGFNFHSTNPVRLFVHLIAVTSRRFLTLTGCNAEKQVNMQKKTREIRVATRAFMRDCTYGTV